MARKFLQMGYTRARRYANHKSGRKYAPGTRELLPHEEDHEKAQSAKMFYQKWKKAREDKKYLQLRSRHRKLYETQGREPRRGNQHLVVAVGAQAYHLCGAIRAAQMASSRWPTYPSPFPPCRPLAQPIYRLFPRLVPSAPLDRKRLVRQAIAYPRIPVLLIF